MATHMSAPKHQNAELDMAFERTPRAPYSAGLSRTLGVRAVHR